MRSFFTSLLLLLCAPAWSAGGALRVYVCDGGQVTARVMQAKDVSSHKQLLRSGNAYWLDGRIDDQTASAMFESAGIWSFAPVRELFAKVATHTSPDVLAAISVQESGRRGRPWPWTINHAGKSFYFETKERAVAFAKDLLARGENIFDVGVMQVNWLFNGERFASIDTAFDPLTNIRVADQIIQEHLSKTKSMTEAVGRYHSKTASLKHAYIALVSQKARQLSVHPASSAQPMSC